MSELILALQKGGFIVIPIGFCSIIALGFFLERLYSLSPHRIVPESFTKRIEELLGQSRLNDALLLCEEHAAPIANIMQAALRRWEDTHSLHEVRESANERGRVEGIRLERGIEVIGVCAAITPLLGLLGTVLGMMDVFQGVEEFGLGDPSFFASGIWKALITTAVGLSVAIPCFIFHRFLLARVDNLLTAMEESTSRISEFLAGSETQQLIKQTQTPQLKIPPAK